MCTIVLLLRPGHRWPVLVAANRDERLARPWDAPGPYWPGVIAGRDQAAGGTWMGINRAGVMAAVLNRPGSLGPAPGKRSRGELPLFALAHSSAAEAAIELATLPATAWRSFNLVVADPDATVFLRNDGETRIKARTLTPGLTMITAHDPNDTTSPRIARHLPRFRDAAPPDPDAGDWSAWQDILADNSGPLDSAINVPAREDGFGTVCSSLLALSAERPPIWLFSAGPPDTTPFRPVPISLNQ